jgi:hypothetical protein
LQQKRSLIEFIIHRNQTHQYPPQECLQFPLLATPTPSLALHHRPAHLLMRFPHQPTVVGDVDLLLQINRDKIEMDALLDNICCPEEAHFQ